MTPAAFLEAVAATLGDAYRIVDDEHFRWLTPFDAREHRDLAAQARYALFRLPELIPGLDPRPGQERWPAILFSDQDDQLAYHALFDGDQGGESIIDAGCWRSWPVGHLAIPVIGWSAIDATFAHELVHAVLDSEGLPGWIQEGFATEIETRMGQRESPFADRDGFDAMLSFWLGRPADDFWSGAAFGDPVASRHAYRLAQVLASRWTADPRALTAMRALPAGAWADEDQALGRLFGIDRPALLAGVLERRRRMGAIERWFYGMFVGKGR